MHPFLVDTEYASRSLFDLLGREDEERLGIQELRHAYRLNDQRRTEALLGYAIDNPHLRNLRPFYELEAGDQRRQVAELTQAIASMHDAFIAKTVSIGAVAGAILQIAKQAVSIGQPTGPADQRVGRLIGSQDLRTVIRQARNQAMHWEDGAYSPAVTACFTNLVADFGVCFSLGPRRSLAKEVIDMLGWRQYDYYAFDMETLIG